MPFSEIQATGTPICTNEECVGFDSDMDPDGSRAYIPVAIASDIDSELKELETFVQELQAERDARGGYLAQVLGREPVVRYPVTVDGLAEMDRSGTLPGYISELHADWDALVADNKDVMAKNHLFATVDVTDFILRVKEDGAVRDPQFLSGEDTRVTDYLNTAILATNAPTREAALKIIGGATEYN